MWRIRDLWKKLALRYATQIFNPNNSILVEVYTSPIYLKYVTMQTTGKTSEYYTVLNMVRGHNSSFVCLAVKVENDTPAYTKVTKAMFVSEAVSDCNMNRMESPVLLYFKINS